MTLDLFNQSPQSFSYSSIGRRDHLTFKGNILQGRHEWLRLTPAYSLHAVNELLDSFSGNDFVLDPFSGTGTTLLAASIRGIPCHGVDINPFLVWLGNLKVRRLGQDIKEKLIAEAGRIVKTLANINQKKTVWLPNIHEIEKWWDAPTMMALARIYETLIELSTDQDGEVTDLLKLAFCRVMIQSSHASFGHQSMSFRKKPADTRRIFFDQSDSLNPKEMLYAEFEDAANRLAGTLAMEEPEAEAKVFPGDSRRLHLVLPRSNYTKVVTSPPYCNRISYIRELRPYMYWLGYLNSGKQASDLDWQAIGGTWGSATSLLGHWEPENDHSMPYRDFNRIIESIKQDHDILGQYVRKYFIDVQIHLKSLWQVLSNGAQCYYVVGNSKFYDTLVPTEEIYSAIFENLGFVHVRIEPMRKRNSKKELYEFVVHAEKPSP